MTLERGTLLHKRYRIVEILGQGGMGSVYRAVDENLGVDVALKENLFTTDEYSRQFRLEAVILANLRHPNLPRVSDHFVVGEQGQYLVMDYIEGEDLRQRMERIGSISEDEAISIGAAMCDALAYLHSRRPPILHRDLKPGNVKITPDGHIFLVDFGLAKVVQGAQATTTGARAMTPGYSPPEQYGTARTDPRTDVYSLGATLYAALSGIIPEDGLARAMDNAQLTPLRKRSPKISKRLAAAIEKAMSIDPAERFQSAEEFQRALLASKSRTQQLTGNYMVAPPPPEEEGAGKADKPPSKPSTGGPPYPPEDNGEGKPFRPKKKKRSGCFPSFLLILLLALAFFLVWNYMPGAKERVDGWFAGLRSATVTFAVTERSPSPPPVENPPTASFTPAAPTATQHPPTSTPTSTFTPTVTSVPLHTSTPTSGPTLTPSPTPQGGGYGQFAFASNRSGIPPNLPGWHRRQRRQNRPHQHARRRLPAGLVAGRDAAALHLALQRPERPLRKFHHLHRQRRRHGPGAAPRGASRRLRPRLVARRKARRLRLAPQRKAVHFHIGPRRELGQPPARVAGTLYGIPQSGLVAAQ